MKAIVCGGRNERDASKVFRALDSLHEKYSFDTIIEGGQRTIDTKLKKIVGGVDYFAMVWALAMGIDHIERRADWKKHRKSAGPIRNQKMLREEPDVVIAFPGGAGTANMVRIAKDAGIKVIEVIYG